MTVIKYPGEERFKGVITPYLRNLLDEAQQAELLDRKDHYLHLKQREVALIAQMGIV